MWKGRVFFRLAFGLISCCEVRAGCGRPWDLRPCPWRVGRTEKVQPIENQQLLTSDGELQVPQFLDQMDGVVKPLQHTLILNVWMCDEVMRPH